jgi:small GTP-binding protein
MAGIPILKVVIVGDENVGKTSIVRRYCEGRFEASRIATIGVDFQTHTVSLEDGPVKLSIWDMAGQDRFQVMRPGFYRGSRSTALVFDVTNPVSLERLERWRQEVLGALPNQKFIVVANKIDLMPDDGMDAAKDLADRIGAPFVRTSALTGEGVSTLFESLARLAKSN